MISLLLSLSLTLTAEPKPQTPIQMGVVKQLTLKGIIERSPVGRYERKDFSPGVKSFRNEPRCVTTDLEQLFLLQEPPQKVIIPSAQKVLKDKFPNEKTRDLSLSIADLENQLIQDTSVQLQMFRDARDPSVENREICVISAEFESPNAVSIGVGFMVFDPQLFFQIIRHDAANGWSLRAVVAHEFAHQLQSWTQDPTNFKISKENRSIVRDKELQADCVASGILSRMRDRELVATKITEPNFESALVNAFASLGDFEIKSLETHHGTAWERALMVSVGLQSNEDLLRKGDPSSTALLNSCRVYIDKMNKKYGEEIWPMGSRL
ncbi:MAG: hypothetical protein J0L93_08195 [Deltaproteobacteria bacterium]|nr:hypothetical protein [Deltaproteobacteria bacterium]